MNKKSIYLTLPTVLSSWCFNCITTISRVVQLLLLYFLVKSFDIARDMKLVWRSWDAAFHATTYKPSQPRKEGRFKLMEKICSHSGIIFSREGERKGITMTNKYNEFEAKRCKNKQSRASSKSHNLKLSAGLKIRPNLLPRRGATAGNNLWTPIWFGFWKDGWME